MASTIDVTGKPAQTADSGCAERLHIMMHGHNPFDCAIMFWRGTSGHAYVHSIFSLTGCPEVPAASVLFVKHNDADGSRAVLKVMNIEHDAPSLNRADIRRCGAQLGANEVHLHFASGDRLARLTATFDLTTRHSGDKIVGR